MSRSVTDALTQAWEQTASQQAMLTDIALFDLQDGDLPSRLVLTATVSDGPELVWEFSIPDDDDAHEGWSVERVEY